MKPDRDNKNISLEDPRTLLHWYDLLCPFCYIAQQRNEILTGHSLTVIEMPLRAHPEIPPEGQWVGPRRGPMYEHLEQEAQLAGLLLRWPDRLPDTRLALAAAEWVRLYQGQAFAAFQRGLFSAHFALGEDLGDARTIEHHAREAGVDAGKLAAALADGAAVAALGQSEQQARAYGVSGTPAWLINGRLVSGLQPAAWFEKLAMTIA
ncbi:MAG TPA: DsbA family protein [Burkholderiales bacterium]